MFWLSAYQLFDAMAIWMTLATWRVVTPSGTWIGGGTYKTFASCAAKLAVDPNARRIASEVAARMGKNLRFVIVLRRRLAGAAVSAQPDAHAVWQISGAEPNYSPDLQGRTTQARQPVAAPHPQTSLGLATLGEPAASRQASPGSLTVFDRNRPGARPVHSTVASHWGCTLLIALLLSVWPEVRVPEVVGQWGEVIARLAQAIETRHVPACARAADPATRASTTRS